MSIFPHGFTAIGQFDDFDAHASAADAWDVQFTQLGSGVFAGRMEIACTAEMQFAYVSWNTPVLITGSIPKGSVSLALILAPPHSVRHFGQAFDTRTNGFAGSHGHTAHLIGLGPMAIVNLAVEQALFVRHLESRFTVDLALLGRDWWLRGTPGAADFSKRASALRGLQSVLFSGAVTSPEAHHRLHECALQILLEDLDLGPQARLASAGNRRRTARLAEEILRARLDDPPSLRELCELAHASERTLHLAFRESFGTAPKTYLRALRLSAAHRRLRHGERSVTEVATDLGMFHFGRFAVEYRAMFGEPPSETLRRARLERR